jgi:hypothetical protein
MLLEPLQRFRTWTFTLKTLSCPDMMGIIVVQRTGFYDRKENEDPRPRIEAPAASCGE